MKQKNKMLSTHGIKTLFETRLTQLTSLASESQDETAFKNKLNDYLLSGPIYNPAAARQIKRLIDNDGKTIYEASTEQEIKIETISLLWKFLTNRIINEEISVDLWIDLYHQFDRLYHEEEELPDEKQVQQWMKRWPSGLNEDVRAIRRQNKERIISLLIQKIENRHAPSSRYLFPEGSTEEDKRRLVCQWWNEARFHLAMAVKNPTELNRMLGNSLSEETLQLYHKARKKGMPVFITPYYLSLLNPTGKGYDDEAIRSYILYSSQLVETYGNIHAWEKEDAVEDGKPNAAGWLLPDGHNIHRRYPDVAILIPDSMGRACGGLCASCQRMYDFQSERLNFNFEELKPKESWDKRLRKLMEYFENDTQLRDILITGGDALMSQNKTLRNILKAVYKMAVRKRNANLHRAEGEKYAELQRVRLGSRLPVYLPMRINDELLEILREFKEKASAVGVSQFLIQTHFQTPLEVTPEAREAIRKILAAGWTITNQLVYNVAASRRGHTAKLRKVLNGLGVLCYYTFSVKGFEENYAVFTPNSRSLQEKEEEKRRKEEARLERQRRLEEEKKNRGKKKPGQKKSDSDQPGIRKSDSRVGMRTYARGRAYDPNRFGGVTPYHDPNAPEIPEDAVEQARREKGEEAENALAGEELASALPETSPIEEEKETAALESVSEAIDGSEEELSGEEAEEAEQDESGEEPDEDKSKDQAE